MILAEDLKWLIGRWPSLVNEIVNALLVGYQFVFSLIGGYGLLKNKYASSTPRHSLRQYDATDLG